MNRCDRVPGKIALYKLNGVTYGRLYINDGQPWPGEFRAITEEAGRDIEVRLVQIGHHHR